MAQQWKQGSGVWTLTTQVQEAGANNWPPSTIPNTYPPYTGFTQGLGSWGKNNYGQLGQSDTINKSSPVQVGALTTWTQVSAGQLYALAIRIDKTLWSWGYNITGQLGQNDVTDRNSPVQVGALSTWLNIAAGAYDHSLATTIDGTLWSWGANNWGQLGQTNRITRSSPVQVGALTDWSQVAGGALHSHAIKTGGTLWSWGRNNVGQLGLNIASTVNRSSPVQVGALTTWLNVTAGMYHSLAIKTDGTLWSWGQNTYGQLGQNNRLNRSSPVQVGALTDWSQVSAGNYHTVAIKIDGTLWAWGLNATGQLGLSDTAIDRSSPVQVGALTNWSQVAAGYGTGFAIKTDGTLWAWGDNGDGALGTNNVTTINSPVQVGTLNTWVDVFSGAMAASTYALLSQV
jgi:alpha-tubulin suppressor-like RCC1 family protein